MIKLEHVNKVFNKHKKNKINVINDTSLEFDQFGLVAILGPSGCGKTTLLNTIGGLDKVNKGHIYIDGKRITKISSSKLDKIRNLNIGYIFQDYKLIENLSVFDNVAIVLKMLNIKDKEEIEKRVLYTLDKVNMLRYKNRPVTMLSGGERQRVGIARALVKNPKIIIADEPTGNLDSKNSIEIMNIIKKISSDRLVILVTHEEELARFYATRIIELLDGSVQKDYLNSETRTLDYRIENKIYLKDFKHHVNLKKNNINVDLYANELDKIKIDLVLKNGNIYIKTDSLDKIEVVENNIELVNDSYKAEEDPTKFIDDFDIDSVSNKKYKEKYSSIYKLGNFITSGFKSILNYSILKKLLLGGFFLSGMFIFYAISNSFAALNVEDKDFVKINKAYMTANVRNMNVDDYLRYESDEDTIYMMPSNSIIRFNIHYNKYYQTADFGEILEGSASSIEMIKKSDLIKGRLPENDHEIVIDKMIADNVLKKETLVQIGIDSIEELFELTLNISNLGDYKIVGITDLQNPTIYLEQKDFINILGNMTKEDYYMYGSANYDSSIKFIDYNLNNNYTLVKGRLPEKDYEVLVNVNYEYDMPLNKTINEKINDKKLTVVGYYKNNDKNNYTLPYYVNQNTLKYNLIKNAENITIYSKNNDHTKELMMEKKINALDSYQFSKDEYVNQNMDSLKSTLLVCGTILLISLLEIFLMIRSSFLSRVKEVGTLRAIGVKKTDIYKMFSGEIIAITTVASLTGMLFMIYVLHNLTSIEFISSMFMVNIFTIIVSIILVYTFNLIIGLLPVYTTMRKTPAQILSRQDVN